MLQQWWPGNVMGMPGASMPVPVAWVGEEKERWVWVLQQGVVVQPKSTMMRSPKNLNLEDVAYCSGRAGPAPSPREHLLAVDCTCS